MPHGPNSVPDYVRMARHEWDLDDDGHEVIEHAVAVETDASLVLAPDGTGGVEFRAETGSAPTEITDIPTAETDDSLVLHPDGAGGVEWGPDAVGSGGSSGGFNIDDYGAVGDAASISDADIAAATDDTAAIQAAIDACVAAGGGDVIIPARIFAIKGALVDTSTFNSQLKVPLNAFGGEPIAIRFRGVGPPTTYGGTLTPGHGSILRSDWNGSISGHPAIISSGTWRTGTASNVMVTFEDLVIVAHDDPKLTALQMSRVTNVRIKNVQIRTVDDTPSSVPSHSNATGYEGVYGFYSTVPDTVESMDVYGFYTGMIPAEQTTGGPIGFAFCARAIEFYGGRGSGQYTFWPNFFNQVVITSCTRGLVFTNDYRWVHIPTMTFQHDPGTFATTWDIDDASGPNLARGFIGYKAVDTSGAPSDVDILRTGGQKLSLHWAQGEWWKLTSVIEIPTGTDPTTNADFGGRLYAKASNEHLMWRDSAGTIVDLSAGGSGAPASADYLVGTSNGGLSAEIVVGTTPGGELGGTWGSPTVDATHSGSAHADFIAKAIVDVKGDLIAATAADTVARVAVGSDGQFLKADSGATVGVSWATPAASGGTIVMQSGTSSPPVPIWNSAGDDYVYSSS